MQRSSSCHHYFNDGTQTVPVSGLFFGRDTGTDIIYKDANVKVTAVENTHFHFPCGSPAYGKYEEVGKMAGRDGVKTVVLTYLPATGDSEGRLHALHFGGE